MIPLFFIILVFCSIVYCGLVAAASRRYLKRRIDPSPEMPFISVLLTLSGEQEGFRENLVAFLEQDYPEFEVLLCGDAGTQVALDVLALFPETHSRLVPSGQKPEPRYDLLVMADSDVRVGPDFLRVIASEIADPDVQTVTCPYRATAGLSIWSALEALGRNTEFLGRVLVMDFPLESAHAIRREGVDKLLSRFIVERYLPAQSFRANLAHRVQDARKMRRALSWRYLWLFITYPIPWGIGLVVTTHSMWPVLALAVTVRFWAAYATSQKILRDPLTRDLWYLVPVQDCLSFMIWMGGFIG
jgi:ceramide glucosyltransferase